MTSESKTVLFDEQLGYATDLCIGSEPKTFLVSTSQGFILIYKIGKELNAELSHEIGPVAPDALVSKICLLPRGDQILAASSDHLYLIRNYKSLDYTVEELLISSEEFGTISAIAATEEFVFVGNEDGDVFVCLQKLSNLDQTDSGKLELELKLKMDEHDDYITSFLPLAAKKTLFCASGDGTCSVVDLKKMKLHSISKCYEQDISSLMILPAVESANIPWRLLMAGSEGRIAAHTWGQWGISAEGMHPSEHNRQPINGMALLDKDDLRFVSITDDGSIQLISANPSLSRSSPRVCIYKHSESLLSLQLLQIEDRHHVSLCLCPLESKVLVVSIGQAEHESLDNAIADRKFSDRDSGDEDDSEGEDENSEDSDEKEYDDTESEDEEEEEEDDLFGKSHLNSKRAKHQESDTSFYSGLC